MRNFDTDNKWSPFDPEWYADAFDKHTSVDEELFNKDEIIKAGYVVPDADGSKSSVFRSEAVLNNSFNEDALRETLKQIYLNNTHRLAAANHDSVHYFSWSGKFSDENVSVSGNVCEVILPTDSVIPQQIRNRFKLNQFYDRWINITDILQNWKSFRFNVLLFIDHRIYSEYELMFGEQQTKIRFRCFERWIKNDYPIYVYKFDTNCQDRVFMTAGKVVNKYGWKVPVTEFHPSIQSQDRIILALNRIGDKTVRGDNIDADTLGDNLEFLPIVNGEIDFSKMSDYNKNLIISATTEKLWCSVFVPKYMHEYPILLPVDVIYRRYQPHFVHVKVQDEGEHKNVNVPNDTYQEPARVYIDLYENEDINGSWKQLIRPIVFSDAFLVTDKNPYSNIVDSINEIKEKSIVLGNEIESFRSFMGAYTTDRAFLEHCDVLEAAADDLYETYTEFYISRSIDPDQEFISLYNSFKVVMETIREDKDKSTWFAKGRKNHNTFWGFISPLVYIPRNFTDRYYINIMLEHIGNATLWEDVSIYENKRRFNFPVDESDFMFFEYDMKNEVWRPTTLSCKHHFPDVYTVTPIDGSDPEENHIYKAMFFYTDDLNVNKKAVDNVTPTQDWDVDTAEFVQYGAIYRDIFMEKFYWMAIHAIYKGIINTEYRWELLEYLIDNPSYERFNNLFLNTMDPYFKMGLATYLHSDQNQFPFDYEVAKLNEAMTTKFLNYQKITNYEMYLNNTWIESYFDYVVTILEEWNGDDRVVHRPRPTFDINRILSAIQEIETRSSTKIGMINDVLDSVINDPNIAEYNVCLDLIKDLRKLTTSIDEITDEIVNSIINLDSDIYSVKDINDIITMIRTYESYIAQIDHYFDSIHADIEANKHYEEKLLAVQDINSYIENIVKPEVENIASSVQIFNINEFMKAVNDPDFFENVNDRNNASLIGLINSFSIAWPTSVKKLRDDLFKYTVTLYSTYDNSKEYTSSELSNLYEVASAVNTTSVDLQKAIHDFYTKNSITPDDNIENHLDFAVQKSENLKNNIDTFISVNESLQNSIDELSSKLLALEEFDISELEESYIITIDEKMKSVVRYCKYLDGSKVPIALSVIDSVIYIEGRTTDISTYYDFIAVEKMIFDSMEEITVIDPDMEEITTHDVKILDSIIEYMNTVNYEYIPDPSWPTYCDIFTIGEIEIVSRGFNNEVGDNLFVPGVGIYTVTEVEDSIHAVANMEVSDLRNTTFRDPAMQSLNPYDSISSGDGLGMSIKVISSNSTPIINDSPVLVYPEKVTKILELIDINREMINPYTNVAITDDINRINKINADWIDLKKRYLKYMSENTVAIVNDLTSTFMSMCDPLLALNAARQQNDYGDLLARFNDFISLSYTVFEEQGKMSQNYLYFNNRMREAYTTAYQYYGNGTKWNEEDLLKENLNNILYEIDLFHRKIMDQVQSDELTAEYEYIVNYINSIDDILDNIYQCSDALVPYITRMEEINAMITEDTIQHDKWYNITSINVGIEGSGYAVGDILRIIPQLPVDIHGEPIHDDEELIMNDKLYLQVTQVGTNGAIVNVEPLIKYALPYTINGSRETESVFGNGQGFIVNITTIENTLKSSSIFLDEGSVEKHIPQYAENDLFTFKFQNNHELDIQYEVFMGGKQINDFIVKRESSNDSIVKDIDVLYINANKVMELKDSSIYSEGENYFVYKISDIEITDPGAGFMKGQVIVVATDQVALKLVVTELDGTPYNGIKSVEIDTSNLSFNGADPVGTDAPTVMDGIQNIDDEYNSGYYDSIPSEGIVKPATRSYPVTDYPFTSKRFDSLEGGNRNQTWLYPEIDSDLPIGDSDEGWVAGKRANEKFYNGINPPIDLYDDFILYRLYLEGHNLVITLKDREVDPDTYVDSNGNLILDSTESNVDKFLQSVHFSVEDGNLYVQYSETPEVEDLTSETMLDAYESLTPPDIYNISEFQSIGRLNIHRSEDSRYAGDLVVESYSKLPRKSNEWPGAAPGKIVIVENDEMNGGHRTAYMLRTFTVTGYFIYENPEYTDYEWNVFDVDWMETDFYPDMPTLKAQYPSDSWRIEPSYQAVLNLIEDDKIERKYTPVVKGRTYIHQLNYQDLSVYNHTLRKWEDLSDNTKWNLDVYADDENKKWGFTLTYLEEDLYSYDMELFLNKTKSSQTRNCMIKRPAKFTIKTDIKSEVDSNTTNISINTGRQLRIRKLFPYEQTESFTINHDNREMYFKLNDYNHFCNEIHAEDIIVYNKSAGRYEDIMNPNLFELRLRDSKSVERGKETQKNINSVIIANGGLEFSDGYAWGYNTEHNTQIFGRITASEDTGAITSFIPLHCSKYPDDDLMIDYTVYQFATQNISDAAHIVIEYKITTLDVYGDGWIHNIQNPMAPIHGEFMVVPTYAVEQELEYEISISKVPKTFVFIRDEMEVFPVFHLDYRVPADRIYIVTDKGRFPLINPSTGKPSMTVSYTDDGTDVKFLNVYNKYDRFEVHTTIYPMRSVYTQRRIPSHGYIDLAGKINKPLNKKYFEFWMNGRLLDDEVTIITPTKVFFHGLKSLRNLEIIEINRDYNEYFSDPFLSIEIPQYSRPYPVWDLTTYLDDALAGTLEGENYTTDEQEYLLSPVWHQVAVDHSEYANYPPNQDIEDDILLRVDSYADAGEAGIMPYQLSVINLPTIEGVPITGRSLTFGNFGFTPITNADIMDAINEEWAEEIEKGEISMYTMVTDKNWYGYGTKLYDKYGILVHSLNDAAYVVPDDNIAVISTDSNVASIVSNKTVYDLD